jgi:hypothetical protein
MALILAIKQLDNITLKLYIGPVFEAQLGPSGASTAAERACSLPVGEYGERDKRIWQNSIKDGSYEQDYWN